MTDPTLKRLAFAVMDGAVSFDVYVASEPPAGEQVVELCRGATVDELMGDARFVSRMARTFFAAKLGGRFQDAVEGAPVALYIVTQLPELDDDHIEALDAVSRSDLEESR